MEEQAMPYHLEGRLLEVCDCRVLCPCWIGEDPTMALLAVAALIGIAHLIPLV
jgi:hypothetical protein